MGSPSIPETTDQITAEWLTQVLRTQNLLTNGEVSELDVHPIPEGQGFYGQVLRLRPEYSQRPPHLPRSLIAKVPMANPEGRALVAQMGAYERELQFYLQLANQTPLHLPKCYYAAGDQAKVAYILLLEDLALTGRCGDTVAGCTAEECAVALRGLAAHHAKWWNRPLPTNATWLGTLAERMRMGIQLYPHATEKFLDLIGDRISTEIRRTIPTLDARVTKIFNSWANGPTTMIHGDFRADNLFFGHLGSKTPLSVIDWQLPCIGHAAVDLGFLLGCSLPAAARKANWLSLLDIYHASLVKGGVVGYSRDQLDKDVMNSLLANMAGFVIAFVTLNPEGARGKAYFHTSIERLSSVIMDTGALDS